MQDISLEQAISMLLEHTEAIGETETVPLLEAAGRILAEEVRAPFPQPPFDRSPLDGYTFAAAATDGATEEKPATLCIIGEECAGDFFHGTVACGEAVRLMTGAAIPTGCDCVIRQEDVRVEGDTLYVPYALAPYENYCFKGEDMEEGALVAEAGAKITSGLIGLLASLGKAEVRVYQKPHIFLASTGDELKMPGEALAPGKIYNSNLYLLAARLREWGFQPRVYGILPDDAALAADALKEAAASCDLLLTTGGVSVGKKDIMHEVRQRMGAERLFWRVAMKPGAPAIAYRTGRTLGVALSGNPFAAFATFEMMVRHVLAKASRDPSVLYRTGRGRLANGFAKVSPGRRIIRAHYDEDGTVRLFEKNASGVLAGLSDTNAFVDIPAGSPPLEPGEEVTVIRL
ncbi:molybdopterin molybdotransferase MoeA [Selenomonas sp. TAMA-11512]|uniref:molybdopterin molybdotransferase MoeA n=1 Tax=Selenomonas sp. TAMA-11512 TaxID=3095337 RepID=UPI00308FB69B|nr:molybdopterin molybdotransferase MoeA [Selenomonas sp. TAMA-11512]